jgi:hypothetical protein
MLFLFVKTSVSHPKGKITRKASAIYRNAARLQYGHKNKPCEILISSGLDVHLALRLCIATLILTVAKIVRSFVTAKEKRNYFCVAQKITIRLLSQPLAYRQTVLGW